MAEKIWSGDAAAIAQVATVTPANLEVADIFTVKITDHLGNTDLVSFTATAATVANVVTGLQTIMAARKVAGNPWYLVTCTDDTTLITITADTAGDPFTLATTATDGGVADTQTLTAANTTACSGPGIFSLAENWVGGVAPVADTDTVKIPATATGTIYGEDLSATSLLGFAIEKGCAVNIGAPNKYLQLDLLYSTTHYEANLAGTGTVYLLVGEYDKINITEAGTMYLQGLLAAATTPTGEIAVNCTTGQTVNFAALAGETMEVNDFKISGGIVNIGSGVKEMDGSTAPDLYMYSGTVTTKCALGAVTKDGGTWTHSSGTVTSAINNAGTVNYNSSGTLTNGYGSGIWDFSGDLRAKTVSNMEVTKGATVKDPNQIVTWTAGIDLYRCKIADVTLDLGTHFTVSRSSI